MTMLVEWGRLNRGVVWHLVRPLVIGQPDAAMLSTPFCADRPLVAVEVTMGQPPVGAIVCPRCHAASDALFEAVSEAIRNQRTRVAEPGDVTDGSPLPGV
jgi:hypothetical protein